jgi:hypothetical protein
LDIEHGAEDADIDGFGVEDEGAVFVFCDVEVGFADKLDFAGGVLVEYFIGELAVRVEPDEGAVRQLELGTGAGAGGDGIESFR